MPALRCSLFLLSSRRSIMWSMQGGMSGTSKKDQRISMPCNCIYTNELELCAHKGANATRYQARWKPEMKLADNLDGPASSLPEMHRPSLGWICRCENA
jgi:hypothetical protein